MKPKVTVLTCVYNGMPFLKEAIDSVLNQTYSNFVYLIIDDASPDIKVTQLIESYDDPRIKLVKNDKNLGVSNTFNKALKLIKTTYVVRLDQDDVSLPHRIEKQINFLENNSNIDIVCSWEYTINVNGKITGRWRRSLENYGSFLGYVLIGICPIWHPSIAFKTKSMIDAGGFDIEYTRAEDFEVTARLATKRYNAAILNEYLLLQRQHDNSQSVEFNDLQADVSRRIHQEVIEKFSDHIHLDMLGNFLRLEQKRNNIKLTKANIVKINHALKDLIKNITDKQRLSNNELKSLKKVIYLRVGIGIRYSQVLTKLPTIIFYPAYYLLSPLQLNALRSFASRTYRNFIKFLYTLK